MWKSIKTNVVEDLKGTLGSFYMQAPFYNLTNSTRIKSSTVGGIAASPLKSHTGAAISIRTALSFSLLVY